MIVRFFSKALKGLLIGISSALLLICLSFAILQTKWAKEQIREKIVFLLEEWGISASVEEVSGQLPFSWVLKSLDLSVGKNQQLKLHEIKLRIAILPLLQGKMEINYLKVERAEYFFSFTPQVATEFSLEEVKTLFRQQIERLAFPSHLTIHHLTMDQLTFINRETHTSVSFGVTGKAMMSKDKHEFTFDLHVFSPEFKSTYFEMELKGSKSKDFTEIKLKTDLSPFLSLLGINGKIVTYLTLEGPWTTWTNILYNLPRNGSALSGHLKAVINGVNSSPFPLLHRKWKVKSEFSIPSGQEIFFKKCIITSDFLKINAKGQLCSDLEQSQGMLTFSFPDLSLLPSSWNLSGQVEGKALYQKGEYKALFTTEELKTHPFSWRTIRGFMKGNKKAEKWEGEMKLTSQDADIPFENTFAFEYTKPSFSVIDWMLKIPNGNVNGFLNYDSEKILFEGSLFANISHLNRFSSLVNEDRFDGNFAIELQLSKNEEHQDIRCVIIGNNMQYQEFLLDDLTISTEIRNVFEEPTGKFDLLAEKFYSPYIYFTRLNFGTSSDEIEWPFFIDAEGRMENPFQGFAKGFWKKENSLLTVELTQFFGDLAQIPFSLKYPTELEWGVDHLNLSPFEFRIGDGYFLTQFELSPIRALGKWDLVHFPLEILSCLKPRFSLKGWISSNGFFDANPHNFEGTFNATLEEANVLHFGKKHPFQAKGTLQAHLDQNILQIHTDLHAIDDQFFDLNATLPFAYTLYPLRITLEETKPTSAEIIAEGKLEDLFDFINLGSNHFTGLISTRLFLSKTLTSPAVQGNLIWQEGSFENYFTGISLKKINAEFEAQNEVVHLLKLTAIDDLGGSVDIEGKFLLKPKEYFPYSFTAEMTHLHALGFDMIDCNLTGPLYLTGDIHNMFAQGNLLVDKAGIHIDEHLPYEIPSLPVTYINRPTHVSHQTLVVGPHFSFHLDVELTAEDKVFIKGRGLNAELQGNVHLHGTDTHIAANGSLQLIKGEFQFSGKIFKLTEGEILFNDKSVPSAYLNVSGTLSLPEMTVIATLKGPLISPQLIFQSNPQKPTSEILSLILFNKNIAEISHAEALQLAGTLVSLSGGAGPDVLETIRKSLGIDRLNIAARKASGSDEITVEIGKYLTRGILITLAQSATSSQIIVEVELPHGFVFQAETQEEEEGKFSLKWTKSY